MSAELLIEILSEGSKTPRLRGCAGGAMSRSGIERRSAYLDSLPARVLHDTTSTGVRNSPAGVATMVITMGARRTNNSCLETNF